MVANITETTSKKYVNVYICVYTVYAYICSICKTIFVKDDKSMHMHVIIS